MRFRIVALTTASLFLLPAVAQADDPAAPPPKKDKRICRKTLITGSIRPLRTACLTAAEWREVDAVMGPINAKGIEQTIGSSRARGSKPGSTEGTASE